MLVQCWVGVVDAGPTLYIYWVRVSFLLGTGTGSIKHDALTQVNKYKQMQTTCKLDQQVRVRHRAWARHEAEIILFLKTI